MPTLKQKMAFHEITENHGSVSKAMLKVGYDPDTAKKPQNLTDSKGWKELMDEFLPDSLLGERHRELLNKRDQVIVGEELIDTGPETQAVTKGLDMAYKLKGSYAPDKTASLNLNIDGRISANPELEAVRVKYIEELKSKLNGAL